MSAIQNAAIVIKTCGAFLNLAHGREYTLSLMRILSLVLALCISASAQLKPIHDVLFASFIPVNEIPERQDVQQMFAATREAIWQQAQNVPQFQQMLAPFSDLRGFGPLCGMDAFLKKAGATSYAALTAEERKQAMQLLQDCPANDPRRLAMNVRTFYIAKTYGPLQEALTGVKLNLDASHVFIDSHRPKLPPTRLKYDRAAHEVALKDGAIDYLIVGSGPAGSVLAHELRRGGKRVLLVERGSMIVPGALETRLIDDFIEGASLRTSVDGSIRIRNGMGVGGGSLVNVDLCFAPTLPSIQFKIASWRKEGRIAAGDFTLPELTKAYAWVKRSIGTRVLAESEINTNNRKLWDGAKKAGLHPKLYDLNTYPPGQSPYPVTDKRSGESELILQAMQEARNPLALLPDADVRRVLFDAAGKTATGVEITTRPAVMRAGVIADPNGLAIPTGETLTIRAHRVILSAGALGSPAILLRSKVANDQIGRGVILHPSMPIIGEFESEVNALSGTQASVFVDDDLISRGYAFESMSAEPLYGALMALGSPRHTFDTLMKYRSLGGFGVMLIDTPRPSNRLTLDADGEPRIAYELSENDKPRFVEGIAKAARMMFLAGARKVHLPTTELRPAVLDDISQTESIARNLHLVSNRSIITSAHMQATNKMGANAATSVVSREFKVWGVEGLYVVDGSVFPTSIGANPMQSNINLAGSAVKRLYECGSV